MPSLSRVALMLLGNMVPVSLLAGAVSSPVLKWDYGGCFATYCNTGWYGSPAVGNIDEDGQLEVLWGSYDVLALNGNTGELEWRTPLASRIWASVALADLESNHSLEVIVGRGANLIDVYTGAGDSL